MFLPAEIIAVLEYFRPAFTEPTYQKALVLLVGTLLGQGNRTVCSALRILGLAEAGDWSKYHHVLNRAQWDGLRLSGLLLTLIVETFVSWGPVYIDVDETLERRWGPQIRKRGHWRDSLASGRNMNVSTSGLRWLVFAVVVEVPWSHHEWALPFLSILLTTPKVSTKLKVRHRTVAQRTGQVVCWLRRVLPGREIRLTGDGAYSVIELGLRCQRQGVTLVAPLRLDARLFDYPPARVKPDGTKRRGRPASVGQRVPTLDQVATHKATLWQRGRVDWYDGISEVIDWATGTALWYTTGTTPLHICWVLVRDPSGERNTVAYFTTDLHLDARHIIATFVKRWAIEVTFELARAHLGVETQRQWSDKAIERTTPALLGLCSIVVLMVQALYPDELPPLPQAAWYPKAHATFHDILALLRQRLWLHWLSQTPDDPSALCLFSTARLKHLLSAVSY